MATLNGCYQNLLTCPALGPVGMTNSLIAGLTEPVISRWKTGDRAGAAGYGLTEVVVAILGTKGAGASADAAAATEAGAGLGASGGLGGSIKSLFHYTDEAGQKGIVDSGELRPSLKSANPKDARYGDGQYLSDIAPGTMTSTQLSRAFLGHPFAPQRFTNYVEINVSGLNVVQGRPGVFVVPNNVSLDLSGRIISTGAN